MYTTGIISMVDYNKIYLLIAISFISASLAADDGNFILDFPFSYLSTQKFY
jgi:predicted membrane channel-forming protein YqfA (hemolysin III family)